MTTVPRRLFAGALCLLTGTMRATQNLPAGRYLLDAETVVRALHDDGFEVQTDAVHLPMALTSTVEHPVLELAGAERLPDGRMRVRLHCRKQSECLPFSVILERGHMRGNERVPQDAALASLQPRSAPSTANERPSNPPTFAADTVHETQAESAEKTRDMHSGEHATAEPKPVVSISVGAKLTMLMEDGHLHIHLPVTALDASSTGREVRVASLDHKHVYRATVVDATTVRGLVE